MKTNDKENKSVNKKEARRLENEKLIYETWHTNQELGKKKFVIKFGVLTWGFPTFLIYSAISVVLNLVAKTNVKYDIIQAIFSFIVFIVFGMGYGLVIWHRNEGIYKTKFPYGRKSNNKL